MNKKIVSTYKYLYTDLFLKESDYCKRYYLDHMNYEGFQPKYAEEYTDFWEGSPFFEDDDWMTMRLNNYDNFMTDTMLDEHHTDVYAMIPPNYFPPIVHYHTYFELVYIAEGTAVNYAGTGKMELHAGDLMVLALGSKHAISCFSDDCVLVNVMVRNSAFWDTFSNNLYENDVLYNFFANVLKHYAEDTYIIFHTKQDMLIKSLILGLLERHPDYHKYSELESRSALSLLFARLMNQYAATANIVDNTSEKEYDITMILNYMQQHYRDISLSSLSDFFGYSERQTRRLLLKFTGKGYQENLDLIRMKEAEKMLHSKELSIEQISTQLGFSSVYSFRKLFNRTYHTTPSEYRAKI